MVYKIIDSPQVLVSVMTENRNSSIVDNPSTKPFWALTGSCPLNDTILKYNYPFIYSLQYKALSVPHKW